MQSLLLEDPKSNGTRTAPKAITHTTGLQTATHIEKKIHAQRAASERASNNNTPTTTTKKAEPKLDTMLKASVRYRCRAEASLVGFVSLRDSVFQTRRDAKSRTHQLKVCVIKLLRKRRLLR